jgi:hypothetical protein
MMVVVLVVMAENEKMDMNNPWIKLLLLKKSSLFIQVLNMNFGTFKAM